MNIVVDKIAKGIFYIKFGDGIQVHGVPKESTQLSNNDAAPVAGEDAI